MVGKGERSERWPHRYGRWESFASEDGEESLEAEDCFADRADIVALVLEVAFGGADC